MKEKGNQVLSPSISIFVSRSCVSHWNRQNRALQQKIEGSLTIELCFISFDNLGFITFEFTIEVGLLEFIVEDSILR